MTPSEINKAIAEKVGWTEIKAQNGRRVIGKWIETDKKEDK